MQATAADWSRMQDGYRRSLAETIATMRGLLPSLAAGAVEAETLDRLRRDLHRFHGSAGTWGLRQVGEVAGRMEALVGSWVQGKTGHPLLSEIETFRAQIDALDRASSAPTVGGNGAGAAVRLLLVHDDAVLLEAASRAAGARGWHIDTMASPESALAMHLTGVFQLIAVGGARAASDHFRCIGELRTAAPGVPIVALLERDVMSDRLAAASAGADLVLAGPLEGVALAGAWEDLLFTPATIGDRVLLVDDDPAFRRFVQVVLDSCGLEVRALDNPLQIFSRLGTERPDLLVLDLEMPTASGLDILRALRTSREWRSLPTVVVTAHHETEHRLQAFESGADRVLVKPVRAQQLKAAVLAGLRRPRRDVLAGGGPVPSRGTPEPDVFIVEDDTALLEMLEYALANRGFRCVTYTNGLEALDALLAAETQGRRPVVLMDVDLPGLDGFTALQQIHRARPGEFQIVIVTVHAGEREQIKALRCGAADYLVKPVSIPVVVAKVERLSRVGVHP